MFVGLVYACFVVGLASSLLHRPPSLPDHLDTSSCPHDYAHHPLILVSMDGFRAEYLSRGLTPTLQALGEKGVRAPYMKPSYPSITFPNHYTLVTGLYPPAHGIVANKFYDPHFQAEFRLGRAESFKARWWGGEPLWRTVESQGKVAATFFWPGSEVDGNHPTYWYYYNESIPFEHRIQQVLSWLELPQEGRPSFITLYMHEPDSTGHDYGPDSLELEKMLVRVDLMVKKLVEGLKARSLLACVNLMVVADHGMAEAGPDRVINLSEYIPNFVNSTRFWDGTFSRFEPHDGKIETKYKMMKALSCKRPELRVYERELLPIRWHMGRQRRVESVVVDTDVGYSVSGDSEFKADVGDHGYDNFFPVMNALFVAHGPDLQRKAEIEAFQNIELYNLMCQLLGVRPAPNNGTWGALHHLLVSPPLPPSTLKISHPEYQVVAASVPDEVDEVKKRSVSGQCVGDQQAQEEWIDTLRVAYKNPDLIPKHLPWGLQDTTADSVLILKQPDSVTAYSPQLKLPRWTSFSIGNVNKKGRCGGDKYICANWRSDVRLTPHQTTTCSSFTSLPAHIIHQYPLFPPEFSHNDQDHLPYLVSNALPFTDQLMSRWNELINMLVRWQHLYGPLNVVAGPVFDYDADSFADNLTTISESERIAVPSHMFLVVSRCVVWVPDLKHCPHNHIDTLAFVYPQYLPVTNCLDSKRFAQEFSATIQDIQKITGLQFYPMLNYEDRVRLLVRVHSNIWGRETWWNRLRNNFIHLERFMDSENLPLL